MIDNQSDIMDYARVMWKRKWFIILPTFLCILITGVASFFIPKKWELDCIVKPGSFLIQTQGGAFQEVSVIDPLQISQLVNQEAYAVKIATLLDLEQNKFPEIKAKRLAKTNLVRMSLKTGDIEQGKSILNQLFDLMRKEFDKRIQVEVNMLETFIENNETRIQREELNVKDKMNEIRFKNNDIKRNNMNIKVQDGKKVEIELKINSLENVLKISQEREKSIFAEKARVQQKIEQIEKHLDEVIAMEEKDAISLLLYSNEVQQNLQYYNTLDRQLSDELTNQEEFKLDSLRNKEEIKLIDIEIDKIKTQIDTQKTQINNIKNDVDRIKLDMKNIQNETVLLMERKERIDYSHFLKEPTATMYPVTPNKRLNVLIAAVLGLALFTLLAFIREFSREQKDGDSPHLA